MVKEKKCHNCGYSANRTPSPKGRYKDLHHVMWCDLKHRERKPYDSCKDWCPFDKELFNQALKHAGGN